MIREPASLIDRISYIVLGPHRVWTPGRRQVTVICKPDEWPYLQDKPAGAEPRTSN